MTESHGTLRMAAALACAVPGTSLVLSFADGCRWSVAANRLDATVTPCQLRDAVIKAMPTRRHLVAGVEVDSGLHDLGAGLYCRSGVSGEERWFASTLPSSAVHDLLAECPLDVPPDAITATLKPDPALGVVVVGITAAHPAYAHRLDEVAVWALSVCIVDELIASIRETPHS